MRPEAETRDRANCDASGRMIALTADAMNINRRDILKTAGVALGAIGLQRAGGGHAAEDEPARQTASRPGGNGLPKSWRTMRKFDAHNHVMDNVHRPGADWSKVEAMIEAAERLGIEKLCCSRP